MKSLQERIAWYEANFPDMAEQGLIRFHDSNVSLKDKNTLFKFRGSVNEIGNDIVITPAPEIDEENKEREIAGEYLYSNIYLSGTSSFQKELRESFNFSASPFFSQDIENDFTFYHELAHVLHSIKRTEMINGQWNDLSTNTPSITTSDEHQKTLYSECVADAFATLMIIRDNGLHEGIGFANLASDTRLLNITIDPAHMTALSIDDAIQCVTGNNPETSIQYPDLIDTTPYKILKVAEIIAEQNPMFAELKKTGQSLKEKSQNINRELLREQKPLKEALSMPQRLKDRFQQAVNRRVSKGNVLGNDGPWADTNSKYRTSIKKQKL